MTLNDGLLLVVLIALVGVAALVIVRTRRPQVAAQPPTAQVVTLERRPAVPPGMVDFDALLSALSLPDSARDEAVLFDLEDGTALVLGDTARAQSFGEVIGSAGPRLVSHMRRACVSTPTALKRSRR